MQRIRKLNYHQQLLLLLVLSITLRSLIAVGFMVDTSVDDGLFTITLCDGPAGINAISKEKHHQHHHDDDDNDQSAVEHGFTACHFWSASSISLALNQDVINLSTAFSYSAANKVLHLLVPRTNYLYSHSRSPPVLLT